MATLHRIEAAYPPWTAGAGPATARAPYVGRHRRPGSRRFALFAMFYRPRHRYRG